MFFFFHFSISLDFGVLPASEQCTHSLTFIYIGDLSICLEDLNYFIMLS